MSHPAGHLAATEELTLIDRLKKGVWDIHEEVAGSPDKPKPKKEKPTENIMEGTLPKFKYVANLGQRYLLQRAIDKLLAAYRPNSPELQAVVTDEQFHADKAAADLLFFGVDPASVQPLPTTTAMIDFLNETAQRDARLLLASHYIIEGSNNGAVFIAKAVKAAYGLEGTEGTYHLQPYGGEIRAKWGAFREAFNGLNIDDVLMAEMIAVGRTTFAHMNAIADEAYAQPEA